MAMHHFYHGPPVNRCIGTPGAPGPRTLPSPTTLPQALPALSHQVLPRWERPTAALVRYNPDRRWEEWRKVAMVELDEEFPT